MPETICMISTTEARAPNRYQKFTFDGTGCFERCLSKVLTIGSLALSQVNNFPAIWVIYISLSSPIVKILPSNIWGGTIKFVGAGTPLKTLPTISNIEPWHGQKNPPFHVASQGLGSTSGKYLGAQPKCVQTPEKTEYSGLFDLDGLSPL